MTSDPSDYDPDEEIVRIVRQGEQPPRCHYCGNESWDLVEQTIGERSWRIVRKCHEARLDRHPLNAEECPPMPDGWVACYRCERALAPDEQRTVALRFDWNLRREREERVKTTTTKDAVWSPRSDHIHTPPNLRHSHPWKGAIPAPGSEGEWIGKLTRPTKDDPSDWTTSEHAAYEKEMNENGYDGPPVEGCSACGTFESVDHVESSGEWDDMEVLKADGERLPYVEVYPSRTAVACAPRVDGGCNGKTDAHARGEPDPGENYDDEDDPREGASRAREPARQDDESLAAMVPTEPVEIEQLMALWKRKERATRTIARRLAGANLIEGVPQAKASGGTPKLLYRRVTSDR